MLVDDRRFRPGTTEGGAGGEDALKVLVRFLVPEDLRSVIWSSRPSSIRAGTPARIGAWNVSSPAQRNLRAPRRVSSATPSR